MFGVILFFYFFGVVASTLSYSWYIDDMSILSTIVSTNPANPSKKGPKPIRSVAEAKADVMGSILAQELRKIDRKIATEQRKMDRVERDYHDATVAIVRLRALRDEFLRDSGVAMNEEGGH